MKVLQNVDFLRTLRKKSLCQLLNFVIGQAKMATRISRRHTVEGVSTVVTKCVW